MEIDFLIRKCGQEIILQMFKDKTTIQTATSIYKKINTSYPYVSLIIKEMVNAGLITKEKKGRQYNLFLTDKGLKVVKSLQFIEKTFGGH